MGGGARWVLWLGLAIAAGAVATLLWNEWQLAGSFEALARAGRSLAAADGQVVRLTGEAKGSAPARDPLFGLELAALRLDRRAETRQWLEQREGSGDNKVLRYERIWSPLLIPSRRFEERSTHVNPERLRIESASFSGGVVTVAGSTLDPELLDRLPATRELRPDEQALLAAAGLRFVRAGDWLYSGNPAAPEIGDVRVRFAAAPPGLVTVIGGSDADRIGSFTGFGVPVGLIAYGDVATDLLLEQAARGDWREAWALRGFCLLVLVVASLLVVPAWQRRQGRASRLGAMFLFAGGLWASTCAAGWLGARLLLALGLG